MLILGLLITSFAWSESATDAPGGYIAENVPPKTMNGAQVAIFKDVNAWDYPANEAILGNLGVAYDVYNSGSFGIDLSGYQLVIVASDQPQSFYDVFDANLGNIDSYVSDGGVLQFNGCDNGWQDGFWASLPGGVTHEIAVYYYNYVVEPGHPIVEGVPTEIYGTQASLDHFTNLYPGTTVICIDEVDAPTTIEYNYGAGTIIASGQCLEYAWGRGETAAQILENTIVYALTITPGPGGTSISGYVTDDATGDAIEASVIAVQIGSGKMKTISDIDGYYELADLATGNWWIICIKRGYKLHLAKVEVNGDETHNISLIPK